MPVSPLEALADAITNAEGWHPGSRSNRNRNPGNMRYSIRQQSLDPDGYSVFESMRDGYAALCVDLEVKVEGKSSTGIKPSSTVQQFADVWAPAGDRNDPHVYAKMLCWWLSHALERNITPDTTLAALMDGSAPRLPAAK